MGSCRYGEVVARLNRSLTGWAANYFILRQVSPTYAAIDRHATRRRSESDGAPTVPLPGRASSQPYR